MRIQLSDHFTYRKLLRFVLPSIIMMVFTSIYSVVDGLFVSNYVGKTPFAALNLVYPVLMMFGALGFMVGTGGSAIVARTLGQGDCDRANQYFSMLVYATIIGGILITVAGQMGIRQISVALGAQGDMLEYCILYGRITLLSLTAFMLQNVFQSFFVTAEKPQIGLFVMIAAGITNIVLDFLFVAVLSWGLAGAAAATAVSQAVGGIVPFLYFARKNDSLLALTKAGFYGNVFLETCTNGSSELMTNISSSIVNILYNFQLMRLAGEDGVAAYGVIMYVNFVFIAMFIGYSIGIAPIIGFHFGAGNRDEMKGLFRRSLVIVGVAGVVMLVLAEGLASPLTRVFVGYDGELFALTCRGFRLYALSFLVCGVNIFGSAFFTALSNGAVSALISFLRTLVFQVAVVLILPVFLEINGVWLAIVVAELLALLVTVAFFLTKGKRYQYI